MREAGNKVIILIILMVLAIAGTIGYAKLKPKAPKEKEIIEPKKEEIKKEEIKEEVKYVNYTNAEVKVNDNKTLLLNITDGTFTMKDNNTNIKLTGVNEKIKSFTYDENAFVVARNNSGVIVLLLSETNNVYVGFYELNDVAIYFRKINTNLVIKDITTTEIISNTKSSIKTAVVLDNEEIRPIIEDKNIYIISNKNTKDYEKVFDNIVIFRDGTIAGTSNVNNKIQYNKQDMVVNKIISVKPKTTDTKCYYIITNSRLFKLCGQLRNKTNPSYFNEVELINKKAVIDTTNLDQGYTEKEMEYVITYDDNTTETIQILSAYIR